MTIPHVPVLAGEAIELLDPRPGQVVVDCTFGAGGHARLLAGRIGAAGTLIAIDRDPAAAERFAELVAQTGCATRFMRTSFVDGLTELADEGLLADVVFMDLGMSSMQIDTWERGFSYSYDAPLDMRMDPGLQRSAHQLVNEAEPRHLETIFRDLGEERYARQIASAIGRVRARGAISSTIELVDVISSAIPAPARFAGGHPAKRVFQALRIAVNDELGQLDAALPLAWALLRPQGRLAAISFHSLEDRRVKRFLAERSKGCICPPDMPVCGCGREPEAELVRGRSIAPTPGEIAANPRARSARLRVATKLRAEGRPLEDHG